jgi:signal transduction histidine kinase
VNDLARDVYVIAHDLQPARLESLGLVAELRSFCEEVEKRHGTPVRCRITPPSAPIPPEVALALFRVAQEGVQNAVRHSGADEIEVELDVSPRWAYLTIADKGRGIQSEEADHRNGLGITGMRERMRLVDGWLDLQSGGDEGTTVTAWAPLDRDREAEASDDTAAGSDR